MPRILATLLLAFSALAAVAEIPPRKVSTDPPTPIVLNNGRIMWVRGPVIEGETVTFFDATGRSKGQLQNSSINWAATHAKTAEHHQRQAETGETVRVLKIAGDAEEANALAQSVESARRANYQKAMRIPLQTEGEKQIIKDDELAQRMAVAQAKCDALGVGIGPRTSAATIMWIQASIRAQCESFKAEARRGY